MKCLFYFYGYQHKDFFVNASEPILFLYTHKTTWYIFIDLFYDLFSPWICINSVTKIKEIDWTAVHDLFQFKQNIAIVML